MRCRIRECTRECGLSGRAWWLEVEPVFIAAMTGRYLSDVDVAAPEVLLKSIKIYSRAQKARRLEDVLALVAMVDRARRKRADSVRSEEDR